MKNLLALLILVLLAAASRPVVAQELLASPPGGGAGDLPPDDALVLPSGEADDQSDAEADGAGSELVPVPEGYDESLESFIGEPMHRLDCCPSYFESSGSWLRRGYWYTEADFLMLNRSWDRKGLIFAYEAFQTTAPGFIPGTSVPGLGTTLAIDSLTIDGSRPGENPLARVKLGRFLFRDARNRDHALEGSYYGAGNWAQEAALNANGGTGDNLVVNTFIDRGNPSFTGATAMNFRYASMMNSGEVNYVVKQRMSRDQMELRPNGEWVRTANPSRTYSFLAGGRYLRETEALNINADGYGNTAPGFYNVATANNLLGGQLGASFAYETARWSLGAGVKGGSFWNREHLSSNFNTFLPATNPLVSPTAPGAGIVGSSANDLSFVGEFQILGKWHLRPNISLRAGFEILYVDSIALAPHQVNFASSSLGMNNNGIMNTGYSVIASSGDIFCMGSSLGIEIYR